LELELELLLELELELELLLLPMAISCISLHSGANSAALYMSLKARCSESMAIVRATPLLAATLSARGSSLRRAALTCALDMS
jgi:hypothetical protein